MPLLNLRSVSFTWDGAPLLDRVGKSTLMKIVAGEVPVDDGLVQLAPAVRIARLIQEVPVAASGQSVAALVAEGYETDPDPAHQWEAELAVARTLSKMEMDGAQ